MAVAVWAYLNVRLRIVPLEQGGLEIQAYQKSMVALAVALFPGASALLFWLTRRFVNGPIARLKAAISRRIMESDLQELFEIKPPAEPVPQKARILSSLICESCGEPVMETRTRRFKDQVLCIPCFEALKKR